MPESLVVKSPKSGEEFRDPRYGTLWEIIGGARAVLSRLGFAYVEVDAGATSPAHFHRSMEELYYITGGSGVVTLPTGTTPVQAGDTVAIVTMDVHSITANAEGLSFVVVTTPPYDPDDDEEV